MRQGCRIAAVPPGMGTASRCADALEARPGRRSGTRRPTASRRPRSRGRRTRRRSPAPPRRCRPGTPRRGRGGAARRRAATLVELERVLGREVLGVEVVRHDLRRDVEEAAVSARCHRVKARSVCVVLEVADVVRQEGASDPSRGRRCSSAPRRRRGSDGAPATAGRAAAGHSRASDGSAPPGRGARARPSRRSARGSVDRG